MKYSIGDLSRRTQVKVSTIRYYDCIGLMPEASRTPGGHRRYGDAEVDRLGFIRHSRDLGFSVEAIRELIALSVKPDMSCTNIDEIARRHVAAIDRRIEQLSVLRSVLQHMVDECGHGQVGECRVIQILSDYDHQIHDEHARA